MSKVQHPYGKWEDFHAGMYDLTRCLGDSDLAGELLRNPDGLGEAMRDVLDVWPFSAEHHLSNVEENRRAWLGQAACCYALDVTSLATREAWGLLTDEQRDRANAVADTVILAWEAVRFGAEALFI